jgi:hypothetical protein
MKAALPRLKSGASPAGKRRPGRSAGATYVKVKSPTRRNGVWGTRLKLRPPKEQDFLKADYFSSSFNQWVITARKAFSLDLTSCEL